MNPRTQSPGAKPSYSELEVLLAAEREARQGLEETLLTPREARAVLIALIFGQPDEPDPLLEAAKDKLKKQKARAALAVSPERERDDEGGNDDG